MQNAERHDIREYRHRHAMYVVEKQPVLGICCKSNMFSTRIALLQKQKSVNITCISLLLISYTSWSSYLYHLLPDEFLQNAVSKTREQRIRLKDAILLNNRI